MPIGDSITHGSVRTGDVRCRLWFKLQNAGLSFDFVGSMYGYRDQTADPTCDKNHEAHSGWRTEQILSIIGDSAAKYKPDMAIIHIGTNDITKTTTVNPVIYVDHAIGFEARDAPDGCHPNNAGAEKMAIKWADAIFKYLND